MKPSDFFIGVIDFFSVILPGALLTYFLKGMVYDRGFGNGRLFPAPTTELAKWLVFLLVAYIVGNLIFMLASLIDLSYDRILRKRVFQPKYDLKYKSAGQIRERFIDTDSRLRELLAAGTISQSDYQEIINKSNREILNTFKWSQYFLFFHKPQARADIQRMEADSKFFRSLVVAFLVIGILAAVERQALFAVVFVVLAGLSYYRYGELRFKAAERAYEMVITYFYQQPKEKPAEPDPDQKARRISGLKTVLPNDFSTLHGNAIQFLRAGFPNPPARITIAQGDGEPKSYISDTNHSWYCLKGRGRLSRIKDGESVITFLTPNAIVPLARGSEFSVSNDGNQPIEILAFEN